MYKYTKQYMQALHKIDMLRDKLSNQRRSSENSNSGKGVRTINNTVPNTFSAAQKSGNNTNNK